ncbi:MAG: hypothetical protein R3A48_23755 [Polyangiales bacterium]
MAGMQVPRVPHALSGKTHSPARQSREVAQPVLPASMTPASTGSPGQAWSFGMHARSASQQRDPAAQRTIAQNEVPLSTATPASTVPQAPREAMFIPAAAALQGLP